jgi:hypothetical protein
LNHLGVKFFYWGKMYEMLKCINFFLLLFSLYIYTYIFSLFFFSNAQENCASLY